MIPNQFWGALGENGRESSDFVMGLEPPIYSIVKMFLLSNKNLHWKIDVFNV